MAYNIAMVGSGYMAQKHCAALKSHPAAHLHTLVVTERNRVSSQEVADQYGFHSLSIDYNAVLSDPDIQIVFICTPDDTHPGFVTAALKAGKHVFCEKPLARTLPEFDAIRLALHNGLVLQVGMNCRFRDQYSIPRSIMFQKDLGGLRFVRGTYLYNAVQSVHSGEKKWSLEFPNGVYPFLHGGGIHCLDLLRWVGGDVNSVFARATAFELEAEYLLDTFSISFEFTSGVLGELLISASAFTPNDFSLDLWFSHGSILKGKIYKRAGDRVSPLYEEIIIAQEKNDILLQYEDMIQAIENHSSPLNSFHEAFGNYLILNAITRSIHEKQVIYLNQ